MAKINNKRCRPILLLGLMSSVSACSLLNPHVGVDMKARNEVASRMDACVALPERYQNAEAALTERTQAVDRLRPLAISADNAAVSSLQNADEADAAAAKAQSEADALARAKVQQTLVQNAMQHAADLRNTALQMRNAANAALDAARKSDAGLDAAMKEKAAAETALADVGRETKEPRSPYCRFYGSLPGAIEYANTLREDYYDAVGDQSKLKSGMALTLIPMSAAAVYLGVTGGSTEAITGLATAGAAGLGLGSFLLSDARQTAYLSGSTTLGCAIARSAPYLVKIEDAASLKTAITSLASDRATLAVATDLLTSQLTRYKDDTSLSASTKAAAQATLDAAQSVLTGADGATTNGITAISKIEGAGPALFEVVDDIRDKVSVEILKTEPDITAIGALANGLSPATKGLINSFNPPKPPASDANKSPAAADAGKLLADAQEAAATQGLTAEVVVQSQITAVNAALTPVQERVFQIQPFVSRMHDMETQLGALTDCPFKKLDNAGFSIDPANPEVSMKVGDTYTVQVTGAIGNITGQVIGTGDPAGLSPTTTGSGAGLKVAIVANKAGSYQLSLADASGKNSKILNITVTPAAKMVLDPAGPIVLAKVGDTQDIKITGVSSVQIPTITTGDGSGLTFKVAATDKGQTLTITAAKSGSYEITVVDGTKQQSAKVAVSVK